MELEAQIPTGAVALRIPFEVDERSARRTLREQIARLERELAAAFVTASPHADDVVGLAVAAPSAGPRMLGFAELERVRDGLVEALATARERIATRAEAQERNRVLLERMLLEPGRYKYVSIHADDIGDTGCVEYRSVPRLGLIGMLMGWWRVKVSSGCPLACAASWDAAAASAPPAPRRANARPCRPHRRRGARHGIAATRRPPRPGAASR